MNADLKQKILEDLDKSGFTSEMKAMHAFANGQWHCDGSAAYFDRDHDQTREIDLVANHWLRSHWGGERYFASWFYIVGEVKKSKTPWVVFRQPAYDQRPHIPDAVREIDQWDAWHNLVAAAQLPQPWKEQLAPILSQHSLLSELRWKCYGVHEFDKNPSDKSRWYVACVSASKAADETFRTHNRKRRVKLSELQRRRTRPGGPVELTFPLHLHFIQPVVILDGLLIAADLSEDGEIRLEEIKQAPMRFCFRSKAYGRDYYRVDVVCLSHLAGYLERCESRHNGLHAGIDRLGMAHGFR